MNEYEGTDRRHWHLSRSVSLGHLVTTASAIAVAFWFFANLDKQISENRSEISHIREMVTLQQENINRQIQDLSDKADSINMKLDKLIERELDGRVSIHD